MSYDFAEHVPGTPYRYKHGWKLVSGENWSRDVKPDKAHVLDMWRDCNPDEIEAGKNWYANANYVAASIAKTSGLSLHQAAGILAVYSPQTGWSTNLLRAAQVMRTKKPVGGKGSGVFATARQKKAAQRILNGEDYETVLSGQKVKAFARLIENPSRPDVVIDRHAMSVAAGQRAPGDVVSPKSIKRYKAWSKAYVEAAKDLTKLTGKPVYPHQVQAATWLARQRKNQELELTRRKSSAVASNAEDQWDDWHDYAEANFPGLLEHAPKTGYDFTGEYEPTMEADFAESSPPYNGLSENPEATATVAPPPDNDEDIQHVVEILLAAYSLDEAAKAIANVFPGIPANIFAAAIANSGGMKGHTAHARLNRLELEPNSLGAEVARAAARREVYYRAAYILNASSRIYDDVRSGVKVDRALLSERQIFRSHESARNGRLLAAERVGAAAQQFGPLLGWYLNPLLNNERECIAANGHNFRADEGTVIGLPGSVHPNCGCVAGPPIEGAGMVNEAIAGDGGVIFQAPRRYRAKRAS